MTPERRRGERGATVVEMAIVLPLLLMFIFGIIDGARLIATHNDVRTATREAARHGSAVGIGDSGDPHFVDCAAIREAGMNLLSTVELEPADITVEYDSGPGTMVTATCPVGGPDPDPASFASGDRVVVTISVPFEPVTPMIGSFFGGITVSSVDRRSILSP